MWFCWSCHRVCLLQTQSLQMHTDLAVSLALDVKVRLGISACEQYFMLKEDVVFACVRACVCREGSSFFI